MNPLTREVIYACTPEDGTAYVRIGDISEIDSITEMSNSYEAKIGELFLDSLDKGTTLSMTVKMDRAEIIRFAMAALDVSNNRIRYHGGKALRLRQIRKWDR